MKDENTSNNIFKTFRLAVDSNNGWCLYLFCKCQYL